MMDTLWMIILNALNYVRGALDTLFSPLHVLGPTATIMIIAFLVVLVVKLFTSKFKTKRYKELENNFYYWYDIKQHALQVQDTDPEKAKELGRNIDKAKLNKVYYDYFFEGLLNNLLTMYIPIFMMLGYVNYTYRPQALEAVFGKSYLFLLPWLNGKQYEIGAAFWYVFCIFLFYVLSFIAKILFKNIRRKNSVNSMPA